MAASSGGDDDGVNSLLPSSSSFLQHLGHMQPLAVHRVRWFYKEDDKWKAFNGADSLNIEKAFRYVRTVQNSKSEDDGVDLTSIVCTTVHGSLYEADVLDRECRPLYWRENSVPIRRGTWFIADIPGKWEAFDENESSLIEEGHIQFLNSLGMGVGAGASASPMSSEDIVHQIKLGSNRVEWHDISEVYVVSEAAGARLVQKMGFSGPRRLNRGYEVDCDEKDCLGPITHLVFLVHGIGQLYYGEGGIVNSRKKLVETLKRSAATPKHPHADGERVDFIPIEWRTNLKLDEGIIDSITPDNLNSLRKMLNATTMDVLYYASPLYREEIIQTIREKLNLVYKQFCDRNPAFEINGGKVSIIAHSLGSVIMHDMLTLWNSYLLEKDKSNADKYMASQSSSSWWGWTGMKKSNMETGKEKTASETQTDTLQEQLHNARLKVSELEAKLNSVSQSKYNIYRDDSYSLLFKIENVFNIGSPLGVFLAMRGVHPREDLEQHLLPTSVCKRTHNIYDPSDPIAYRLEPLIYGHYSTIPPVRLAHMNSREQSSSPSSNSSKAGWLKSLFTANPKPLTNQIIFSEIQMAEDRGMENRRESVEETSSCLKKVLNHRIDYVLEASFVEYLSAITSHQSYWQNVDFAKFVMQVLACPVDEEIDIASRL